MQVLYEKRTNLVNKKGSLHQDNAKPHTALKTIAKLEEYNEELLTQLLYSPDIASKFCLEFKQNHLSCKIFNYNLKIFIKMVNLSILTYKKSISV